MELPDDVIALIKEFSRPLTRPDWRTLHKMPYDVFHISVLYRFNVILLYDIVLLYYGLGKKFNVVYRVLNKIFLYIVD